MLEIQYEKFGPPSLVAKCAQAPEPDEPAAWDAIVEVDACAVNPSDLAMIFGRYGKLNKPPAKIGMEATGKVIALGSSVTSLDIGDRVMIMANDNWAQKRKLPATTLHKIPADIDPLQAALMKVNPATARLLLAQQQLKKNDWVIQNAPLSSVGRSVIQIARSQNVRTINIVRRPEAIEEVLECGGDIAIEACDDLNEKVRAAIGRAKLKLALDAVGGSSTLALASCLDNGSKLINYGMLSGEPCQIGADHLIFKGIELRGFWLSKYLNRMTEQERQTFYDEISQLVTDGHFQSRIDSCYKLTDISEALKRAETPGRDGKVMLLPNGDLPNAKAVSIS